MLHLEPPESEAPIPSWRIVATLDYLRRLARMLERLEEFSTTEKQEGRAPP